MRYFAEIAYKGTHYAGWQVQPNGITVQQKMDEALSAVLRDTIHCIGCGRTDTGVHASQFYLHFDTLKELPAQCTERLNSFLPDDIAVRRILPVADSAHARFDAVSRTYIYRIAGSKNPFTTEFAFYKPFYRIDFSLMQDASTILMRYDDFPTFCKSKAGSKTTVVRITKAGWKKSKDEWQFEITADRFLRGMVRLIVGAMLRVGEGKISLAEFENGIREKRRLKGALSAPAHGLFLTAVTYPYL